MTTEERLKQYIDNDEVYQGYKNGNINLTDFEKFCIQHCKDIEEILEENQKYEETIDKAINFILEKVALQLMNDYLMDRINLANYNMKLLDILEVE